MTDEQTQLLRDIRDILARIEAQVRGPTHVWPTTVPDVPLQPDTPWPDGMRRFPPFGPSTYPTNPPPTPFWQGPTCDAGATK